MKRYLLLILLGITFSSFPQSQNVRFENLSVDDGLSYIHVRCIFQDSRGFMWFGTSEGLNKYDGYKFTVYTHDPKESTSISDGDIRATKEDKTGNLWIATADGGLNMLDRTTNTFTRYLHDPANKYSILSNYIHSLFIDGNGNIIAGSEKGISVFNTTSNQFENHILINRDNKEIYINTVFQDRQENIWVGSPQDGLLRYDLKSKRISYFPNDTISQRMREGNISCIVEDHQHYLWLGTSTNGLFRFDPKTETTIQYAHDASDPNSINHNVIFSVFEDSNGNLWIGTQNNGINVLDKARKRFVHYTRDDSDPKTLGHNSIRALFEDRVGTIWIGTQNGGINYYNQSLNKFKLYKHSDSQNSVSSNVIKGFCEDRNGNIWISTEGAGLSVLNPSTGNFTFYRHSDKDKNSLSSNYTLPVYEDRDFNIWIGTYKAGLNLFIREKGIFKVYKNVKDDSTSISSNIVHAIYHDKEGKLWIGTTGGLNLFDRKSQKFVRYNKLPTNPFDPIPVLALFEDSANRFWVGTSRGLFLLDKKTGDFEVIWSATKFKENKELHFQTIVEDREGNLWTGTDQGLFIVDHKDLSLKKFQLIDGVLNPYVAGILKDEKGNLWISSNRGLSWLDPISKKTINYGVWDGLQNEEFKRFAYTKTKKGEMYFGGINGFNVFHPDSIQQKTYNSPVYIIDFQILNESVRVGDKNSPLKADISLTPELTLSYDHSVFSFEYAALNYITPHKQRYQYILEGFDKNWNKVGNQRKATYTNLDPGSYTFKVKSIDYTGHESNQMATIKIIITPPFWLTWWFKSLAAIFIVGSFIVFYKIRLGNAKKRELVLEKLVQERTKQLALSTEEERQARYESEQLTRANEELQATLETNNLQTKIIENKNAELDAFFYRISHDLKGPVASLLGLNILAKMEIKDKLALDYIERQHLQVERMDHIITGLIKLTKLDKTDFEKEWIDFNKLVDECIMSFNGLPNFSRLAFKKQIQPDVEFYSQWALLNAIVQNLVENAIKYSREQNPFAQIIVRRENGSIVIQVEDNGQGIPVDHQSKIFEMFYRATLSHADGVGLGLYILKRSVDRLHGTIEVKSELGVGSIFTVKLPVN